MFNITLNKVVTARGDGKREYYLTISKMLKDIYGRYKYPVETQDVCIVSSLGYNTVNGFCEIILRLGRLLTVARCS